MQPVPTARRAVYAEAYAPNDLQPGSAEGVTILIADDEPAVRTLLARVLRRHGYTVVEAANGADALILAATAPRPFQLLLTDVIMPQVTGPELAARLRASGQVRQVIFMTGCADDWLDASEAEAVLRKPFSLNHLTAVVTRVLAQHE